MSKFTLQYPIWSQVSWCVPEVSTPRPWHGSLEVLANLHQAHGFFQHTPKSRRAVTGLNPVERDSRTTGLRRKQSEQFKDVFSLVKEDRKTEGRECWEAIYFFFILSRTKTVLIDFYLLFSNFAVKCTGRCHSRLNAYSFSLVLVAISAQLYLHNWNEARFKDR